MWCSVCSVLQCVCRMLRSMPGRTNARLDIRKRQSHLQCVAVCCSVLQCVAVCCSVLQCVAVCCSVLQCVVESCRVLQIVAVCCSMLQSVPHPCVYQIFTTARNICSVLQCVAVCCSVLQSIAMRCSVLQSVAPCHSVLQCVAVIAAPIHVRDILKTDIFKSQSHLRTLSSIVNSHFFFLAFYILKSHSSLQFTMEKKCSTKTREF